MVGTADLRWPAGPAAFRALIGPARSPELPDRPASWAQHRARRGYPDRARARPGGQAVRPERRHPRRDLSPRPRAGRTPRRGFRGTRGRRDQLPGLAIRFHPAYGVTPRPLALAQNLRAG